MPITQYASPNRTTFGRAHGMIFENPWADYAQQRSLLTQREQGDTARAGLAAAASRYPHDLSQQRFNTLLPMLTGEFYGGTGNVGGQSTPGPEISAGPVWNQQQIGQQVNAAQARNTAQGQSQQKGLQQSFAGRGFGSNSPLLQALSSGVQMNTARQNAEDAREIPWQAAQGNARQLLASQQAQEEQHANRMQEDIERRRLANTYRGSLLSLLGSMV